MIMRIDFNDPLREKVIRFLDSKAPGLSCPVCKQKNFILGNGFVNESVIDHLEQGVIIGGPSMPEVVIVCSNCGNILKFSAGVMGLLKEKKASGKKSNKVDGKPEEK
jgi:hypothetical protein